MSLAIYQVDAFTNKPFFGNPAAVCVLPEPATESWMQQVASEMNLSETAFLHRQEDGYRLRWFTPKNEVDLCGHATLASAHILWELKLLEQDREARFYSNSGLLSARKQGDWIELNFPAEPEQTTQAPANLADALGVEPVYIGKNRFDYLVEVDDEEVVKKLKPDFTKLSSITARGIIVTSRTEKYSKHDFVSRFFAPAEGINEDPVTGSAHCCLGPYWAGKLNKNEFVAYQASERGGEVKVRLEHDRVYLSGQAVTTLKGELLV